MFESLKVSPQDYHRKLTCDRSNIFGEHSWLSKSVLWELDSCSLFRWRHHPRSYEPTESMQWGSLVDCLTTTPELVRETVAVSPYDSYRSKEARDWKAASLAAGKVVVSSAQFREAERAAEMLVTTCRESAEIFGNSDTQTVIGGKLRGVQFKGLLDLVPRTGAFLCDLKTTNDFSVDGFGKKVAQFGYHVQMGLYLGLWNAMFTDDQRHEARLIWQDSTAPYEVAVTELAPHEIEAGQEYADRLLQRLTWAALNDEWPMLCEGERTVISRPAWAAIREGGFH